MSTAVASSSYAPISSPVENTFGRYRMSSPLAPRTLASSSSPLQPTSSAKTAYKAVSSSSSRLPSNVRASSSRVLKPGPLGLGTSSNTGNVSQASTINKLRRQQFRQKCQDAMARDRDRDRGRRIVKSRDDRSGSRTNSDSDEDDAPLRSDDLVSSDIDGEAEMEYVRRVLAVDYKRMLREMERTGETEMGWLDPDEVAWLEEEIQREGGRSQSNEIEPPADLTDEDEDLYAQFQHSQGVYRTDDISEDEDAWLDDEELQKALDQLERGLNPEDTQMSDI